MSGLGLISARVVAPSRSLPALREWHGFSDDDLERATARLSERGVGVTFAAGIGESGPDGVAPVETRLDDLHEAYRDESVQLVFALSGGSGVIQLLDRLDYDLIARHDKPLLGYSDIGLLHLALLARIGRTGHYGPSFAGFADDAEHALDHLPGDGLWSIVPGVAEGPAVGGSAQAVQLLKGTDLLPALEGSILFLESPGQGKATLIELDTHLRSLALSKERVHGIVLGRHDRLTKDEVTRVVRAIPCDVPLVANAAFGHCTPRGMVPIGSRCSIRSTAQHCSIRFAGSPHYS